MMLSDCSAHAACGESFLFSVSVLTTAKTYRIYRQIRPMPLNALYKDCREAWPKTVCAFANVCGDISTTIWFFVLAPQIWKNWRRRSVEGLSILWATANFTASLINCFFAFSGVPLPVYIQISAIYMPVLEFFILVQFWFYSKHAWRMKFFYGAGCFLIWIALIILELSVGNAARSVEWIAIVLWSVESFPQVILNMRLRSTSGQATCSVVLGLMGKTADFLANYLLRLPPQYVIMTYFSSTLPYINGIQVIWYPKPHPPKTTITPTRYGSLGSLNEEPLEANDCEEFPLTGDPESSAEGSPLTGDPDSLVEVDRISVEEMASICSFVRPNFESRTRIRDIPSYQRFFVGYLLFAIVAFSLGVCMNTHSGWGVFAPLVVAVVLFGALLYRNHREGRMHFADPLLAWLDRCCHDQPVEPTWLTREQAYE